MICPHKGKKKDCFALEEGKCRILREVLKGPCKFYKPREQYRQEIREAEARALKNIGTGIRTHGKIEWSEDAHHEREKGKDIP